MSKTTEEKDVRATFASELESHELLFLCVEQLMQRTPVLPFHDRYFELMNELQDRISGMGLCDSCREKARASK